MLLASSIGGCGARSTEAAEVRLSPTRVEATAPEPAELTGRVFDEHGRPIEGVEVVVCDNLVCGRLMERAEVSAVSECDLPSTVREVLRVVRSDRAGRFAVRPAPSHAELIFVHPGHGLRSVAGSADSLRARAARVELPDAARLMVDARCEEMPCEGVVLAMHCGSSPPEIVGGRPLTLPVSLDHLPPGRCELRAATHVGLPDEGRATADLTLVAGEAQSITLRLEPTGTGLAIEGTLGPGPDPSPIRLYANCGDGESVRRSVTVRPGEPFRLPNVGPPPCRVGYLVGVPGGPCAHEVTVDQLPATVDLPAPDCPPPPSAHSSE